jgi:hypothetical protein
MVDAGAAPNAIAFPLPGGGRCVVTGPLDRAAIEHALALLALQLRAFPARGEAEEKATADSAGGRTAPDDE